MDPCETSEPMHEMQAKHEEIARKILKNLRKCIHEYIEGWALPDSGWTFSKMWECIPAVGGSKEASTLCKLKGIRRHIAMKHGESAEYLQRSIAYQVISMKRTRVNCRHSCTSRS